MVLNCSNYAFKNYKVAFKSQQKKILTTIWQSVNLLYAMTNLLHNRSMKKMILCAHIKLLNNKFGNQMLQILIHIGVCMSSLTEIFVTDFLIQAKFDGNIIRKQNKQIEFVKCTTEQHKCLNLTFCDISLFLYQNMTQRG